MEFLKNHFEKILLTLALLALMGTAAFLAMRIGTLQGSDLTIRIPKDHGVKPIDRELYEEVVVRSTEPPSWGAKHRMFAPVPSVFVADPKSGRPVLRPKDQVAEPAATRLPVDWLKKYNLPNTAGIEEKDTDGDGFSNAVEHQFGTDPTNPESFPRVQDYLTFHGQIPKKFFLRFLGYTKSPDNIYTFQVNVNDFDVTYFVKLGEQIASGQRKENYWVERFEPEFEEEFDPTTNSKRTKEVSRLIIRRGGDDSLITLVYRQWSIDNLPSGRLRNELEKKDFVVTKEDTVTIRGETYKVVDIEKDAVILSDSLNRVIRIGPPKGGPPTEGT